MKGTTMKDLRWLAAALLLFALPGLAMGSGGKKFTVGADINDKGEVTQVQADPDIAPAVMAVLVDAIRHWQFVPARQDGRTAGRHRHIPSSWRILKPCRPAAADTTS
jgi:hypothetical protein